MGSARHGISNVIEIHSSSPMSTTKQSPWNNHEFRPRNSSDSRSPCPALNALANHGYIPHNGRDFTFVQLIEAMVLVYNISYPLAFVLASAGFLTAGNLSIHSYDEPLKPPPHRRLFIDFLFRSIIWVTLLAIHILPYPSWSLDLQSLSRRGSLMIAHDGALVHPDGKSSTAPDRTWIKHLLQQALRTRNSEGDPKGGLDFFDIVRIQTEHVHSTGHPRLSQYHNQISLGGYSLLWEIFQDTGGIITTAKLRQWLYEEKLPFGWWDGARPKQTVGLFRARKTANEGAKLAKQWYLEHSDMT